MTPWQGLGLLLDADGAELGLTMMAEIIELADDIPLFVEEM